MADAKRCDICGQFYFHGDKYKGINTIRFENDLYNPPLTALPNNGRPIDICPTCAAAFVNLYNARKELANAKEIRT